MNEKEIIAYNDVHSKDEKYWLPCLWAMSLIKKANQQGKIKSDLFVIDMNQVELLRIGYNFLISFN
jgi:hypothetical protein